jgi:hypothetical protein
MKNVLRAIRQCGFRPLAPRKSNANGPDVWAIKNERAFSFEIKKCKITKRNSVQSPPVEKNRKGDDFIAIELPSGYVLIEPMGQHLRLCTKSGYRTLW